MKTITFAISLWFSLAMSSVHAGTTIDPVNKYAYGANFGWMDCTGGAGETATGVAVSPNFCSGYIYAANVGWINLGSGAPANCTAYQNNSATDFGVNVGEVNNVLYLSGYGYGPNIGWVTFEQTYGIPAININGQFSGSVWSANCGWISLTNAFAYVQTDTISPGVPALNFSYSVNGSLFTVYWQACPSWILEQNNMLNFPAGWMVSSGVTTANGTNYCTITPPRGNLFFRLINP